MVSGVIVSAALYLVWRRLIFKEEQYTLAGWLCLAACISLTISVGRFLIST